VHNPGILLVALARCRMVQDGVHGVPCMDPKSLIIHMSPIRPKRLVFTTIQLPLRMTANRLRRPSIRLRAVHIEPRLPVHRHTTCFPHELRSVLQRLLVSAWDVGGVCGRFCCAVLASTCSSTCCKLVTCGKDHAHPWYQAWLRQ
jgi:hypothetical protein